MSDACKSAISAGHLTVAISAFRTGLQKSKKAKCLWRGREGWKSRREKGKLGEKREGDLMNGKMGERWKNHRKAE